MAIDKVEYIRGVHRKLEYDASFHDEAAFEHMLSGGTVKTLAKRFGVSTSTIKRWYKQFPSFWSKVQEGINRADEKVVAALYKRAVGFSIEETKHFVLSMGAGAGDTLEEVQVDKYFPPDVGAAMNWLKNRKPDEWRDKQEVGVSGEVVVSLNLGEATDAKAKVIDVGTDFEELEEGETEREL